MADTKINRPKILMVSEEGRGGGALKRMLYVAKSSREVADITICCPINATHFIHQCQLYNIKYKALTLRPLSKDLRVLLSYIRHFWREVRELKQLIHELSPNIIHANGSWQFKAVIAAHQMKVKCIWHMNDTRQPSIVRWIYRGLSSRSDYRIYASYATREYYSVYDHPKRETLISAPVFFIEETLAARGGIQVQKSSIEILTVAYINPNKGIHLMIEALHELVNMSGLKHLKLRVVGPVLDSQKKYARKLEDLVVRYELRDHVIFDGYSEKTMHYLAKADVYLCASAHESSPMAVWEAMAVGLPVVATPVGDLIRLNASNSYCKIVDRTPADIANGITTLLNDPANTQLMVNNAREMVKKDYSLKRHLDLYIDFCNTILND